MGFGIIARGAALLALSGLLAGCSTAGGWFGGGAPADPVAQADARAAAARQPDPFEEERRFGSSFFDLFNNNDDPSVTLEVNKYLWQASLEVLDFLPIETVDPFSGVIVTGYGTPPGGGRAYRATVYVQDPALEARALKVALATRAGPVAAETVRAVEDAILTRARQLRGRDAGL